jgi:hypothetical protein
LSKVPTDGEYRGVSIHAGQSEARLKVIQAEIDQILDEIESAEVLADMAGDARFAPETRLLCEAKCKAIWSIATQRGKPRPDICIEAIEASTAGLDSTMWRSKTHYATGIGDDLSRAVPREVPLPGDEGI